MKGCWLAGLVAVLAVFSPSVMAGWYGYLDIGPRYSEARSGDSDVFMDSRGSFLGFAVEQALTEQIDLLIQAEYEIDADADSDKDFGQNDTFVGLATPLGSLRAGNLETPLRHLADPVDRFPDTIADPSELWNGDIQATDSLYYQSPTWGGFRGEVALIRHDADNRHNGVSSALWFESETGGIALASEKHVTGDHVRRHRVTLFRSLGAFALGFTAERESQPDQPDTLARLFSLAHSSDKRIFKLQYGKSDLEQFEEYLLSVGIDFLHSNAFGSYLYLHRHEQEEGADFHHAELGLRFSF
ncbi:hypothetical protein FHR99_000995 [Litorivivens lipolytica]|uniref:Porin domain-containing protein n=1 Tax=Litorivivens lipolytica TaxID=1524264 RepID=A0A7W4Z4R4_9GAMM|nr:porin [Litorivivens lipolytica]MBB3046759.1 hypothetical protein [Litorivivens lipolytica]